MKIAKKIKYRFLIPLLALPFLGLSQSACGFHPLYGSTGKDDPDVQNEMQKVFVANIPTRFGQEMRLALQEELSGSSSEDPQGYIVRVMGNMQTSAIGTHSDNTSGRSQMVGSATWHLYRVGPDPKILASGSASALDGYDPTIDEVFAKNLDNQNVEARVARALAAQMAQGIAVYFKSGAQSVAHHRWKTGKYLDPDDQEGTGVATEGNIAPDGMPDSVLGYTSHDVSTEPGGSTGQDE
ncbi:hypothetical protein FAI40_02540 [Acetobacteraceae bacterium]|nr:hypothetical protein FAI40_02540 [Acetobacteraceae bacterium]